MGLWYILEYQYPTEMAVADLSCLSFRFFLLLQIRDGTHQHLVASNIFADLAQVFCKNVHLSRLSSQRLMGNLQSAMSNLKYLDGKPDNLGACKIFRKKDIFPEILTSLGMWRWPIMFFSGQCPNRSQIATCTLCLERTNLQLSSASYVKPPNASSKDTSLDKGQLLPRAKWTWCLAPR